MERASSYLYLLVQFYLGDFDALEYDLNVGFILDMTGCLNYLIWFDNLFYGF